MNDLSNLLENADAGDNMAGDMAKDMAKDMKEPDMTSWSKNRLASWLADHKGQSLGAGALLEGLSTRLVEEGVPVDRTNVALQDHHPQISARGFRWIRGEGVTDSAYPLRDGNSREYVGSPVHTIRQGASGVRRRLSESDVLPYEDLYVDLKTQGYTDYAAMPLIFSDGSSHFISWATKHKDGFSTAQLTMIYDLLPLMCMRFELDHSHLVTETLLNTYHGKRASAQIRAGTIRRNQGERISAILVYSDMRGFTKLADTHSPEDVTQALGEYYEAVAGPIEARGGDIIKMIGDGLLSIFTYVDPMMGPCENTQACEAVDAVLEGHRNLCAITAEQLPGDITELRAGFALHTGTVTFGNVGSSTRLDFTAIGPAVNEVTRVEALTKTLGAPILATSRFAKLECSLEMASLGHHELRGVSAPQEIFTLKEFL